MILTSTSPAAAIRFTPSWLKSLQAPPVFLLRAGDVLEREMMQADLASEYRAGETWPWELKESILVGFRQFFDISVTEELVTIAEAIQSGEDAGTDQLAIYNEALGVLAEHWSPYKQLIAQQERRNIFAPIVAFRRFCCGWENVASDFKTGPDRLVDKAALSAIDPLTLRTVGLEAYNLQWGLSAEKNSPPPSKSADAPVISNSGARSTKAGRSARKSTSKTRA